MKFGILTFHNAINYGAVLQAYATQCLLQSLGHKAEIIDYKNQNIEAPYHKNFTFSHHIKETCILFIVNIFNYKKRLKFQYFSERYLHLSKIKYSTENLSIYGYDAILIGSDQVWNPKQTGGFDPFYWGQISHDGKLISWAASFKENAFKDSDKEQLKELLQNFDAISVREEKLKDFISPYTKLTIHVTLDPTLLIDAKEWEKLCQPLNKKPYILVYALQDAPLVIKKAKELGKSKQLPVIVINPLPNAKIGKGYIQTADPIDFLSYFRDAEYIIAASFHGTAFSIIFKKNFYCFIKKQTTNVRISSLLQKLGLEGRIINESSAFNNETEIVDYKKTFSVLEQYKRTSIDYLNNVWEKS